MKSRIVLLLAAAIILSYGEAIACHGYKLNICKTDIDCVGIIEKFSDIIDEKDSIKCYADSIKASNNSIVEINASLKRIISDNITIDNMIKSQEFYSKAFEELQSSFTCFLTYISIIATILAGISIYRHFKIGKEFDKCNKDISDLKQGLESQKNQLDLEKNNIFREMDNLKRSHENQINELKKEKSDIIRDVGNTYFVRAMDHFKEQELALHFRMLSKYYNFLVAHKVDIQTDELCELITLQGYTKSYIEEIDKVPSVGGLLNLQISAYQYDFQKFIEYCKDKPKHLTEAKKLYDEFQEVTKKVEQRMLIEGASLK